MENLVTITVKSTHFYLIDLGQAKLLVDGGWVDMKSRFPILPFSQMDYQKNPDFEPVVVEKNDLVSFGRADFAAIGIPGEIVATPVTARTVFPWYWTAGWPLQAICTCPVMRVRRTWM